MALFLKYYTGHDGLPKSTKDSCQCYNAGELTTFLLYLNNTISYPLFVPRIRKDTHLKESVFPEAEG